MNKIITTSVVDPSIGQPLTAKSLEFLQNANKEIILGFAQAMIGERYDVSKAYVLKGLDAYGTNQYHEGWVLWNGEVYYSAGKSTTTAFTNVAVMTITVTNDATADPLTFTDLVPRNVHNVRRLVLSDAVSGTGTFDLSNAIYIQNGYEIKNKVIAIGNWNMDSTSSVSIAHGLQVGAIINVSAYITRDDGLVSTNFLSFKPGQNTMNQYISVDATNVILQHSTDSFFDNVLFDGTGFNRGWVTIQYIV